MEVASNISLKKIAADSSIALALKVLAGPISYLTPLVITRLYGTEEMGTYALTANLLIIIAVFCRLGLDTGLMRFLATLTATGQLEGFHRLFWPALGLVSILSIIMAICIYTLGNWLAQLFHAPHLPVLLGFAALSLPLSGAASLCAETLRALDRVRWVVFHQTFLTPVGLLAPVLVFAYLGYNSLMPFYALGMALLGSVVIGLGFLATTVTYRVRSMQSASGNASFKDLLDYSWPLFLSSIIMLTSGSLDRVILGLFSGPEKVAHYEAAIRIANLIIVPLIAVTSVVPPIFARFFHLGDLGSLETVAQVTTRWMYCLALPLTLISILLTSELLGFFGPGFTEAGWALRILVAAQFVNVACGAVGIILSMTGHQLTLIRLHALATGLGIPLMVLGTAVYGVTGLAMARGFWLAGINLMMCWAVWRALRIKAYASQVHWATLGAVLSTAIFYLSKPHLGVIGGLALCSLGYLALVTKTVRQDLGIILHKTRGEAV